MKLFEPGKIGNLDLKNRIVMASLNTGGAINLDGTMSQRGIDYLVARAKGGTGLITTGSCRVTREIGSSPKVRALCVDGVDSIAWLSELAEAVHDYQAKLSVQFQTAHGHSSPLRYLRTIDIVSPSVTRCCYDPKVNTREITTEQIERLIKAFEVSAGIVRTAGVDAIELNFHAGYLGDEFVTALWNKRNDKYGGDLEGRLRFSLEVIKAVRRGAGDDFPLIYKFGLTHHIEGGRKVEEGIEIARRLELAGVDALVIDSGCHDAHYWSFPTAYQPAGLNVDFAEAVKNVVKIPVITVGKLGYPELAEGVLQDGKADFIALGRPLLADPEWANKVKEQRYEDIRPCICDNEGCLVRANKGGYLSCTVNPACGIEKEFAIEPAKKQKAVLVVGGGPGGMEAARVAALRGHEVTLWEKSNALGGALLPASAPDFKKDYRGLINYLSTQIEKLGVKIELGKKATPELVQNMKPQVIFIATGTSPSIPEIPGIESEKVVTANDILSGKMSAGKSVVVIGGGLVGCETALYLAQHDKNVTIVEVLEDIARDMSRGNRMHLLKLLAEAKVKVLIETSTLGVNDEGITVADKAGKGSRLVADTVVLAVGLIPQRELVEALQDKVPEVYAIGDCVEPRKVINAIWEGFRTARLI